MVAEGSGLAGVWPEWMQMLRVRGSNVRFQILWRSSIGREEKVERGEGWEKGVELPRVTFWIDGSLDAAWNSTGLSIVVKSLELRNDQNKAEDYRGTSGVGMLFFFFFVIYLVGGK
jgi:hypothetical protein